MIRAKTKNKELLTMEPKAIATLSQARLARAVDDISQALQEQKAQIHAFRQSVHTLNEAVGELRESWLRYDTAIARIDIGRLRRRARRLARIMDI